MFMSITENVNKLTENTKNIEERLNKIEEMVTEIKEIKTKVKNQEKIIDLLGEQLRNQLIKNNELEQHSRKECLRVKNMELDKKKRHDNHYVKNMVYKEVLRPLLQLAVDNPEDDLQEVPEVDALLKNAHILPGSKENGDIVLVRLNLMDLRAKLFKNRREFQKKNAYKITEDLTALNVRALSGLLNSEEIEAAWSM